MVAQSAGSANRDLTWPALTGKREMRGSDGIGRHVASWIAEQLGFTVIAMVPIAKAEGRKQPYEKWADARPGKPAGEASEYRSPFEIMRSKYFRMRCGVGVLAGKSGLVVIDIDSESSWDEFVAGRDLPRTMALNTHSGRQLVFRDETGISYKTQGSQLAPGVDVRGRGGLFVVYDPGQPERHFTDITSPADLPAWLMEEMPRAGSRGHRKTSNSSTRSRVTETDIKKLSEEVIPPGQHNQWLLATALSLVNKGFTVRNRQDWYMIATAALSRSDECTDAKGHVDRERFPDADIMAYFDTALEKKAEEDKRAMNGRDGYQYGSDELIQSAADVPDEDVEWIWSRYLPRCVLTQLDGEKGHGKSSFLADIIARATRGLPMPGEEEAICDPMNVFLFTEEVMAQNKKKLRAAGADLTRVFYPHRDFRDAIMRVAEAKLGGVSNAMEQITEEDMSVLLPTGSKLMLDMIRRSTAGIIIFDPITNYVDTRKGKVDTNSDPSVRAALDPLVRGLEDMNAAGIMVRHLNKDTRASARHRGIGSTAFQNVSRVHLLMGRLAEEYEDCGMFGLNMQANNYTPAVKGTMTFDVVDSDVKLDSLGHYVGKVEWRKLEEDIDADMLVRGNGNDGAGKRGPVPVKGMAIKRILIEMGNIKQTWDSAEAMAYVREKMEEQGFDGVDRKTIDKARNDALISSDPRPGAIGLNDWHWPAKRRVRESKQ